MTALDQRGTETGRIRISIRGPAAGTVAQLALLASLAAGVGLHPAGWAAAVGYAVALALLLTRAMARAGARSPGPADWVTLTRAELAGGVLALVVTGWAGRDVPPACIAALAAVALSLDAVDGQVARRTGTASALGARFDMEVDAFLVLVLSAFVAGTSGTWAWVVVIGAMRYVFAAAFWVAPWLRAPLPPSLARKSVAAAQGVVLVVMSSGALPQVAATVLAALALAALLWSFGRDIRWLWRNHRCAPGGTAAPGRLSWPVIPGPGAPRPEPAAAPRPQPAGG